MRSRASRYGLGGRMLRAPLGRLRAHSRPVAAIRLTGYCQTGLREWILPYELVRNASDPDATILAFCEAPMMLRLTSATGIETRSSATLPP